MSYSIREINKIIPKPLFKYMYDIVLPKDKIGGGKEPIPSVLKQNISLIQGRCFNVMVTFPELDIDSLDINFTPFKYAKGLSTSDVTLKFYEGEDGFVFQYFNFWKSLSFDVKRQLIQPAGNYFDKFGVRVFARDGKPVPLFDIAYSEAFPRSVSMENFGYDDGGLQTVEVVFSVGYCTYNPVAKK